MLLWFGAWKNSESSYVPSWVKRNESRFPIESIDERGALPQVGIDFAEKGSFDEYGRWMAGRRRNGDQTNQKRSLRLDPGHFQIRRVRLYQHR